jgi:hypothetical protein
MFLTKHKHLLVQHKAVVCDGNCVDMDLVVDDDSSDDEIASNKYVGSTEVSSSDFYAHLLADTATQRKLKGREAFVILFRFLCDHAGQSEEHMGFIAANLENLKADVPSSTRMTDSAMGPNSIPDIAPTITHHDFLTVAEVYAQL